MQVWYNERKLRICFVFFDARCGQTMRSGVFELCSLNNAIPCAHIHAPQVSCCVHIHRTICTGHVKYCLVHGLYFAEYVLLI